MRYLYLALLLLLFGCVARAQVSSADCSAAAITSAFASVTNSTTTFTIPACTSTTSGSGFWGASDSITLTVPSGSTNLTIQGAGSKTINGGNDQTIIVDNNTTNDINPINIVTAGSTSKLRIVGITIQGGTGAGTRSNGALQFTGNSSNIRIDHIHINANNYPTPSGAGIRIIGCMAGVVDHSIFDAPAGTVWNHIKFDGQSKCNSDALGDGDQSWTLATNFGNPGLSSFFYAEDNTFNNGAGTDCVYGGKYVWRFNQSTNTAPASSGHTGGPPGVQTHPTLSDRIRGCRAYEAYQNTFTAQAGNYMADVIWISAGGLLAWGNVVPSSSAGGGTGFQNLFHILEMRSDNTTYGETAPPGGFGYCGTFQTGTASNWDQNSDASGHKCLDQPGAGPGDLLTGDFVSNGGTNNVTNAATSCIYSSPCAYPRQALEPIYGWLNNITKVPSNPTNIVSTHWSATSGVAFTENVDYYMGDLINNVRITFDGTLSCPTAPHCGVGVGTKAQMLTFNCVVGMGFWVTNEGSWNSSGGTNVTSYAGQGQLYKCTSTNTWTLYYTPAPYPHPLIGGSLSLSPSTFNFGSSNVGVTSSTSPQTFTLTNNSSASATSLSATLSGINAGDFSISSNTCTGTLANGGAQCTLNVSFTPTAVGSRTATLNISYSGGDGASPQTASLFGTGTAAPSTVGPAPSKWLTLAPF